MDVRDMYYSGEEAISSIETAMSELDFYEEYAEHIKELDRIIEAIEDIRKQFEDEVNEIEEADKQEDNDYYNHTRI